MEKYIITLQTEEIGQLRAFVAKGRHSAQKVINALILAQLRRIPGALRQAHEPGDCSGAAGQRAQD